MRSLIFAILFLSSIFLINATPKTDVLTLYYQDFETYWGDWTYIDGNFDGYYWVVGRTSALGTYEPPEYGTNYAFYSDDVAGNGVINTNEEWISPAIYIGNLDSLTLQYSYGFRVYQSGEKMWVEARFFIQGEWGGWQTIAFYTSSSANFDINRLNAYLPADSIQIRWVYNDEEATYHWGWACAVDNVKLIGYRNTDGFKVYVWDNSAGIVFFDDETGAYVGFADYLIQGLFNIVNPQVDTIVMGDILPPLEELLTFDALFVVNGTREGSLMSIEDAQKIEQYFGAGGNVYIEGNNIVEFLHNYYPPLLDSFRVLYGGNTFEPFYQIQGMIGTFTEGEAFFYFPDISLITSIDRLTPIGTAENILQTTDGKAYICRGVAYSYSAEKSGKSIKKTSIINALNLSAFKKINQEVISQDLRDEMIKKILGFMGLGRILVVDYASSEPNNIVSDLNAIGYYNFKLIQYGPSFFEMRPYSLVFWRTGRSGMPLSEQDTINIKEYIKYGGRIILTGENLASSIGVGGYMEEVAFLINFFGVDYLYDSVFANGVTGVRDYNGFDALYDGIRPDRITGLDTCFLYRGSKANEGAGFGNIYGKTKTLFLGFSYDCLTEPDERQSILLHTFNLFGISNVSGPPVGINEEKNNKGKYLLITDQRELEKYLPLYDLSGRKITKPEKTGVYIHKNEKGITKILFIK